MRTRTKENEKWQRTGEERQRYTESIYSGERNVASVCTGYTLVWVLTYTFSFVSIWISAPGHSSQRPTWIESERGESQTRRTKWVPKKEDGGVRAKGDESWRHCSLLWPALGEISRCASYLPRSCFMIFTLICTDRDGARELHSCQLYVYLEPMHWPPRDLASMSIAGPVVPRAARTLGSSAWIGHNRLPMISVAVFFVSAKQEPAMVSLDRWLNLAE